MNTTNATTTVRLAPRTIANAPEGSRSTLEQIQKGYGFIPNLMATFANSPAVLNGYLALDAQFNQTGFSPLERQLVLLTASVENECRYCTAAHSTILKAMMKAEPALVAAIRANTPLADAKLDALVTLVREIVANRGYAAKSTVAAFIAAGYRNEQLAEVLLGVALKTISNYLDHLNPVAIEAAFAGEA